MPIREFLCPKGHVTEKILQGLLDSDLEQVVCDVCKLIARRKQDVPLVARRNPEHGIQK